MQTGIIYNNEMDDFSLPDKANVWDIEPSIANFIEPGKRPLSSMCPAILLDGNDDVTFVIGTAGGVKITSTNAYVTSSISVHQKHTMCLFFNVINTSGHLKG